MNYYVVDAFADELFGGNPAGVCLLNDELPDEIMQKIAFENNLAETALLLDRGGKLILRWFTPEVEIDLCGHATLAAAFVQMNYVKKSSSKVSFETQSGILTVEREGNIYTMDFPSRPPVEIDAPPILEEALGCKVLGTYLSRDLLVLVENEDTVRNLAPDIGMIKQINSSIGFAVIVTAKGGCSDFVSRFFAPNAGIIEDPVTGSAHCTLIPFWSGRLNKTIMTAEQLSKRGGVIYCKDNGDRVKIGGSAVCYLEGELKI